MATDSRIRFTPIAPDDQTEAAAILKLAGHIEYELRPDDRDVYAVIPPYGRIEKRFVTCPIGDRRYRSWLLYEWHRRHYYAPSKSALDATYRSIRFYARQARKQHKRKRD